MSDDTINPRRRGKIALLPRHVREELCRRLDDGKQGEEILTWLNAQPETVALVAEKFEGEAVSHNNLSQWFKGGFQDWKLGQAKVEKTQALMEISLKVAEAAGGSMSEGAQAIAAGKIMTALEAAEGKELIALTRAVATLRGKEIDKERTQIARDRTQQRAEVIDLDRQKFQRLAVGKFIDWALDEKAREIATSDAPREVKMDQLIDLMFGKRPEEPNTT